MKCPMKFGGEKRVSCSCEREACAWWVGHMGACAVRAARVVVVSDPKEMPHGRDEIDELRDEVIGKFFPYAQ